MCPEQVWRWELREVPGWTTGAESNPGCQEQMPPASHRHLIIRGELRISTMENLLPSTCFHFSEIPDMSVAPPGPTGAGTPARTAGVAGTSPGHCPHSASAGGVRTAGLWEMHRQAPFLSRLEADLGAQERQELSLGTFSI